MLTPERPDRIHVAFDDPRLVADAGLLLPVTLAGRLGLSQPADSHLDLGDAPGRANAGDKILTLVASALAGGDCIDDDALRCGGTGRVLSSTVKAPSTLGTFLRSFRWGHVRQMDRVSRELLARAWDAGAGPGDSPLTIDLDSTVCETYGLAKEGARHHGYTGQRGSHPLLAGAAGTGEVLMARLRAGRANTARGAAHFLRETVGRVRHAGATGQLTVRTDSGFYTRDIVTVCRNNDVRFSITVRQHTRLRNIIEAIPERDWTPIPYWMEGAACVAEITYRPFRVEPDAAPVRLIVRRSGPRPAPNWRSSPATAIMPSSRTERATPWNWNLTAAATPRSRTPSATSSRAWPQPPPLGALCRQRRLDGRAGAGAQPGPLDSPHRPGRAGGDHQDPAQTVLLYRRTTHSVRTPPHFASSQALALGMPVQPGLGHPASHSTPDLTAPPLQTLPFGHPLKLAPVLYASVPCCLVAHQSRPASPLWAAIGASGGCRRTQSATSIRTKPEPSGQHIHHSPSRQQHDAIRWIRAYGRRRHTSDILCAIYYAP